MRKAVGALLTLLMVLAAVASLGVGQPRPVAAAAAQQPAGFVSSQWRVIVRQTVVAPAFADFGIAQEPQKTWLIVLADVTNLGAAGPMKLGTFGVAPGSGQPGYFAPQTTVRVNQKLGFGDSDTVTIPENSSVRVALAFAITGQDNVDPAGVVLGLGGQRLPLATTIATTVDPAKLPALVPSMQLETGTIQSIDGGGSIVVASQSGTRPIAIASAQTPPKDQCYGAESAQAVMNLTGGQVWLEKDEGSDGYLVWGNDAANNTFVLVNARLMQEGAANYQESGSIYGPWLKSLATAARQAKQGLWQTCKDAAGTYINPPTPTAEQVRAQYQQVDVRDLAIRPDNYLGKKIVVAGTVFNIEVDGSTTGMQIWVPTPDGDQQAVVVVYKGDSTGIYKGTYVTVYGLGAGSFDGTNAFGGQISQPLIAADLVDH